MEMLMEILGWTGAALVLGAYALLSAQKLQAASFAYHGANIVGSILLAAYAFWHNAQASVMVNAVWLCIGIAAVYNLAKRAKG